MEQACHPGRQDAPPRPPEGAPPAWRRELRDAIASRVLPRLAPCGASAGGDGAARLAALALAGPDGLAAEVEALRAGGLSAEALLLDFLTPAARRLGELWLADRVGFLDVTAASGRLGGVVRALGPALEGRARPAARGARVLLAAAPGEQHVLGLSIVAAFFRRAGWDVTCEPRVDLGGLCERVAAEDFAAVGLSAGGDRAVAALPAGIAALRRASREPGLAVLVGGPAFLSAPGLGRRVGADAAPRDAPGAVRAAARLAARAPARAAGRASQAAPPCLS